MTEHAEDAKQPPLSQILEANDLLQKTWLMLVQLCHKPDLHETIECLATTAGSLMEKRNASPKFVADTKTMLAKTMEACYDVSVEKTLANMRDAYEQVNARLPSALEERLRQ